MLGTYKLIFGLYRSLIYLELRSNDLLKQPILIQQNLIKINEELKVKDDYDSDESDTSEKSEYGNL